MIWKPFKTYFNFLSLCRDKSEKESKQREREQGREREIKQRKREWKMVNFNFLKNGEFIQKLGNKHISNKNHSTNTNNT